MSLKKNKTITIIGNIGSGKSTLFPLLAKKLRAKPVKADDLYLINPFFPLTVKDRKRWSLASDLWFLKERVKIAQKELDHSNRTLVIDSGVPMSWIYSYSRIKSGYYTRDQWQLYREYYNLLTKSLPLTDILINLTAPETTLIQRIYRRGREYEKKYFTIPYLQSIAHSIKAYQKQVITPATKVITIYTQKIDLRKPEQLALLVKRLESSSN